MVSLKDRRATPVLGSRLLRSYVPLRCGPSESGSARDTIVAAYVFASSVLFLFTEERQIYLTTDLRES